MTKAIAPVNVDQLSGRPASSPSAADISKVPEHRYEADRGMGKLCSGSDHHGFGTKLISDVVACISTASVQGHENYKDLAVGATMEALKALEPADPVEGMLAAQVVALHSASMECLRRASLGQAPDVASKLRKDGANLARAMTDMLAALDRKRGKGQQHIRVERVMVHEGGQAIVGNVTSGSQRTGVVE